MTKSSEISTLNLARSLQPQMPARNKSNPASAVVSEVLTSAAALTEELRAIAGRHAATAPSSADRVLDLSGVLARAVLDWIERWPS